MTRFKLLLDNFSVEFISELLQLQVSEVIYVTVIVMLVRFRTVLGLRLRSDRVLTSENGTNGESLFGESQDMSDSYRSSR